jgi:arylformamidase
MASEAIDYEAEYNNRRRVPEHPAIQARWAEASARLRQTADSILDAPYGPGPRHHYDLLQPNGETREAPLAVYIHGGYWQRGDRADNSFVAEALVAHGARVALPSYSLCPQVKVADIIAEMRRFLAVLWRQLHRRPVVVGHSAGGHLAAAMLASDWSGFAGVPPDLVRAAYSISGVFELAPLIGTSLNEALGLDEASARAASPVFWPAPPEDRTFIAAVGGAESSEFLRQSKDIANVWSAAGLTAECVVIPGANHFTVVEELWRPDSAMTLRILEMAQAVQVDPTGLAEAAI